MKKGSSELALLDVNVLLAIAWPNHQFHASARRRLETSKGKWATCALTELGFVRLSSNKAVVGNPRTPMEAVMLLAAMVKDPGHVYLKSLPSPASAQFMTSFNQLLGSKQVTDAYLLKLAAENGAVLLTFDTRIKEMSRIAGAVEVLS